MTEKQQLLLPAKEDKEWPCFTMATMMNLFIEPMAQALIGNQVWKPN